MLPPFRPIASVADPVLKRLQDALQLVLTRVCACPLLDGVVVSGITFSGTGPTGVTHRLGRAPIGMLIINLSAPARLYRVPPAAGGPNEALRVSYQADAACVASLWIF